MTVWQEMYDRAREMLTVGKVVLIRGKVVVRNQLAITCESVELYGSDIPDDVDEQQEAKTPWGAAFEEAPVREFVGAGVGGNRNNADPPSSLPSKPGPVFYPSNPAPVPPPPQVRVVAASKPNGGGYGNGGGGKGAGNGYGNGGNGGGGGGGGGGGRSNKADAVLSAPPGMTNLNTRDEVELGPRTVVLMLTESDDANADIALFSEVLSILRRNQGRDSVLLEIRSRDTVVHLEMSELMTRYSPAIQAELTRLLGEGGVRTL
ncbi:MAG: hypothetical protein NTZ05_19485, partial [Chloroflexi bacterium]|nr:hypothetical protein [Chloroflexota bacterium]